MARREIGAETDRPHQHRRRSPTGHAAVPVGTQRCCGLLKTKALLDGSRPATSTRRSAARAATRSARAPRSASSRCATRTGSGTRSGSGPSSGPAQRRVRPGESIRVFPLSNWTEIDVWHYIHVENIPIVPLYFAKEREVIVRGELADRPGAAVRAAAARREAAAVMCRMRSLGCSPCTGAIRSDADTVPKIIEELSRAAVRAAAPRHRPRPGRLDGDQEARGLLLMSRRNARCSASARPAASTTARAR
jgi:sulfate adenylyltransferase subunit 2